MPTNTHKMMVAELLPVGAADAAEPPRGGHTDLALCREGELQVLVIGGAIAAEDYDALMGRGCKVETVFHAERGAALLGQRRWDVLAVFPGIEADEDGVGLVKELKLGSSVEPPWASARVINASVPVVILPFRDSSEYALYVNRDRWRLVDVVTLPVWRGVLMAPAV